MTYSCIFRPIAFPIKFVYKSHVAEFKCNLELGEFSMSRGDGSQKAKDCDDNSMDQFMRNVKTNVIGLQKFYARFEEFLSEQKKQSKELWNCVTRYNILDALAIILLNANERIVHSFVFSGPPVCPFVEKEELLQDLLIQIQEKTSRLFNSLWVHTWNNRKQLINISNRKVTKGGFDDLSQSLKALERQSLSLEWNVKVNPAARGAIIHRPPSEYLEDIADIIFQIDIALTCMLQYFEALNLRDTKSYEHLMNSFSISPEIVDFVREFLIKNVTLFTWYLNRKLLFPSYPM